MSMQKFFLVSETKFAAITIYGGKGKGSAFYALFMKEP